MKRLVLAVALALAGPALASPAPATTRLQAGIDRGATEVQPKVVAWRRDIHEHPELANHEVRTAKVVADHLRALGLEVRTEVAHTGVVGVLRGGKPGPAVALRADMDALPVTEEVDLPFRSRVRATYNGQEVGVMHACGHDNHVAILMGVAEVLSGLRAELPGSVTFLFQPAEEGPPAGERGGAELMIEEGALENPKVSAVFGLHVFPLPLGTIAYRPGPLMAAGDTLEITVRGRQTHGALPWAGVDPIVVASQIVLGLQTITSRQTDVTSAPAVVTIGTLHAGTRRNIIPDTATMSGTVRTFDAAMRMDIHERIRRTAERIAEAAGAKAEVQIVLGYPITSNDPALAERMRPTLARIAGERLQPAINPTTTAEDFSLYQEKVPGLFFFLGVTPEGTDPKQAAPNHSPRFFADEGALVVGVHALASLAADYLQSAR